MVIEWSQTLHGAYALEERPLEVRALSLEVRLRAQWPAGRIQVAGVIDAEALATHQPVTGSVLLADVVRCDLTFLDDRGDPWGLVGGAHFRWSSWRHSLTRLALEIRREGMSWGHAELRWDWFRELPATLRSLRATTE